jgi:hypothetical protein
VATNPANTTNQVLIAVNGSIGQSTSGRPSYRIYRDTQDAGRLPGPRGAGSSVYGREVNTAHGFVAGSPQAPTPSPQEAAIGRQPFPVGSEVPGMIVPPTFAMPTAPKTMLEPSTYVPGVGWINSAKPNG